MRSAVGRLVDVMSRYGMDAGPRLVPPGEGALGIAAELARRDPRLGRTDAVILAHALADPDARFFFTRDGKMLRNRAVARYEEELRAGGARSAKLVIRGHDVRD